MKLALGTAQIGLNYGVANMDGRPTLDSPKAIYESRPDYVLILPWNLADEVMKQNSQISDWGGRFVVPIPEVRVV
jgi:hypothetical protein